jgi:30S ribosomal protein S31
MGKGDKKSRRGKIIMGSFGVKRRRRDVAKSVAAPALKEEPVAKAKKEKPAPKPKPVAEEVKVEEPVVEPASDVAEKPAKKKPASKAKAPKKEDQPE